MPRRLKLLVSCEHGGNRVPHAFRHLFAGQEEILQTHRGYDIGILPFARSVAARFDAPLLFSEVTRLLVDLNRSSNSRNLFSEFSRTLPVSDRQFILERYYAPYRREAEQRVARLLAAGSRVLHLSVHSFTPVWNHRARNADIGLLYDPARQAEKALCLQWQQLLSRHEPKPRVRRNYPYRGNADALVTTLRRRFDENAYLGVELEISQRLPQTDTSVWDALQKHLLASLQCALQRRSLLD